MRHGPGCPCCGKLELNGPKGFSNSMADRVPPARPAKRYGGIASNSDLEARVAEKESAPGHPNRFQQGD